jgi:hypothetical protein
MVSGSPPTHQHNLAPLHMMIFWLSVCVLQKKTRGSDSFRKKLLPPPPNNNNSTSGHGMRGVVLCYCCWEGGGGRLIWWNCNRLVSAVGVDPTATQHTNSMGLAGVIVTLRSRPASWKFSPLADWPISGQSTIVYRHRRWQLSHFKKEEQILYFSVPTQCYLANC